MVVFVDFNAEGPEDATREFHHSYAAGHNGNSLFDRYDTDRPVRLLSKRSSGIAKTNAIRSVEDKPRRVEETASATTLSDTARFTATPVDNRPHTFAAALGCYPVVKSLTQWLDLNSLFSLSLTCRQFRANLLQFRSQLVRHTLRCEAEDIPLLSEILGSDEQGQYLGERIQLCTKINDQSVLLAPKIGKCARDLVGECRRCGRVVCRNCTVKPPANPMLRDRYRRICSACLEVPLKTHTLPPRVSSRRGSEESTYELSRPNSSSSYGSANQEDFQECDLQPHYDAFTSSAFLRDPCTCHTAGVWLCQPCGQGLRAADITYKRVWTWRSRYSTHIGGLGTGMGEGNQGQKCGRGEQCLAGKDLEVEIDCSAEEADELLRQHSHSSNPSLSSSDGFGIGEASTSLPQIARRPSYEQEPGYFRQEIEGIGGVVKKKVKKRVRVGATVTDYEDERETGKYLEREAKGINRSWCGWCSRVVPAKVDEEETTS